MSSLVKFLIAGMAGLTVGPLLIVFGLFVGGDKIVVSGWQSDWSVGTEQANPYIRSYVAIFGLFALAKEEAVYFTKRYDDDGQRLLERCTYELSGNGQPSRWWSITLYNALGYYPMNRDLALSIDATRVQGRPWRAIISPVKPEGDVFWISSRNADTFDLTLRMYEPTQQMLEQPETSFKPPTINRVSCEGDSI